MPNTIEIKTQELVDKVGSHYVALLDLHDSDADGGPDWEINFKTMRVVAMLGSPHHDIDRQILNCDNDVIGTRYSHNSDGLVLAKLQCLKFYRKKLETAIHRKERGLKYMNASLVTKIFRKEVYNHIQEEKFQLQKIKDTYDNLSIEDIIVEELPEITQTIKLMDDECRFYLVKSRDFSLSVETLRPVLIDFYSFRESNVDKQYPVYALVNEKGDTVHEIKAHRDLFIGGELNRKIHHWRLFTTKELANEFISELKAQVENQFEAISA